MKQWEEIIKDRMVGLKSPLPEGSLDRFHTKWARAKASKAKRRRIVLFAAGLAVAATLGVLNVSRHHISTEGTQPLITEVPSQEKPLRQVTETVMQSEQVAARQSKEAGQQRASLRRPQEETPPTEQPEYTTEQEYQDIDQGVLEPISHDGNPQQEQTFSIETCHDNGEPAKNVNNVGKIIEGGYLVGSTATLATILASSLGSGAGVEGNGGVGYGYAGQDEAIPGHRLPLQIGITASLPISGRWHLITGVEYDMYHSVLSTNGSSGAEQYVHYLTIPVRMDWTAYTYRQLEFYLGGGLAGNFCLAASVNGEMVNLKDGPSVALIGTGGIQYRISDNLGIYLEPGISGTVYSYNQQLSTYRTKHPIALSLSTGLRININTRQ